MPKSDALFAPPTESWQPISRKYLMVNLIGTAITWIILGGGLLVGAFFAAGALEMMWIFWVTLAVVLLLVIWSFIRAPRVWKRWGYAERDEDVYITSGLMFRRLTCVPYGRMQLVEVTAGPIERMFGLASVRMVTASSTGSINIPGLDREAAEAIRDRFINRGQHLRAGI